MSRHIDRNKPFSEEDKAWLLTRADGEEEIALNEKLFGDLDEEQKASVSKQVESDKAEDQAHAERVQQSQGEEEFDEDLIDEVSALNVADLKKRLGDAGVSFKAADTKETLQEALLNHLQDQRDLAE